MARKLPLFNDPLYGFISFPSPLLLDLVNHPYFQRLRRITQLGLTSMVYPGANHTRFQHAIGAMRLMDDAIQVLRSRGVDISSEEQEAACAAILLHDIGHGPFSHALEHDLVKHTNHEDISTIMMERLNKIFDGRLDLAIQIFSGKYHKHFLHQLISSQVDVDRLDYLNRDSFFTGVAEGVVNVERIISVMDVVDDKLVFYDKGVFSLEKFLMARRLMYWQVYLHKTVLAAEFLLENILKRAHQLASKRFNLTCSNALKLFLYNEHPADAFKTSDQVLSAFADLDDSDVMSAVKMWCDCGDPLLEQLCRNLVNRHLYKVEVLEQPMSDIAFQIIREKTQKRYGLKGEDLDYLAFRSSITLHPYHTDAERIMIASDNGKITSFDQFSELYRNHQIGDPATRYVVFYPKEL